MSTRNAKHKARVTKTTSTPPPDPPKPPDSAYDPLAPIPVPQSQEVNSDSVWALFEDVQPVAGALPRAYASTDVAPLPELAPLVPAVAASAPTEPGPASHLFQETELGAPEAMLPAREEVSTTAMSLEEMPTQARIEHELAIIGRHHERIAKAIRLFWGHKGCVEYMEELILNGGDGAGNNRVGFKLEVVSALINLSSLHSIKPPGT